MAKENKPKNTSSSESKGSKARQVTLSAKVKVEKAPLTPEEEMERRQREAVMHQDNTVL